MATLTVALAAPALANMSDRYYAFDREHAELFSYNCLESAPSFAAAQAHYDKRRSSRHSFRQRSGYATSLEVIETDTSCVCTFTYPGVNDKNMGKAFVDMLNDDYAKNVAPDMPKTREARALSFDGTVVNVTARTAPKDTIFVLTARATREGSCTPQKPALFQKNKFFNKP